MKNLGLSIASLISIVYLSGCSTSNTQVRLISLSYTNPNQVQAVLKPNERLNSKRNNIPDYIFPGDVLTFTVELEDPNFEFISLLAVKFNGVTIRANTNDSIVSTSDCGANICVNFPFEVSAEVTEYTVEEVKFAKLNGASGINVNIDNQSQNSIVITTYNDALSPYIDEALLKLTQMESMAIYFDVDESYNGDEIYFEIQRSNFYFASNEEEFWGSYGRRNIFVKNIILDAPYLIQLNSFEFPDTNQLSGNEVISSHSFFSLSDLDGRYSSQVGVFTYGLFTSEYEDTTFFNRGNDIYMLANDVEYFLFELNLELRTRVFFGTELGYSLDEY